MSSRGCSLRASARQVGKAPTATYAGIEADGHSYGHRGPTVAYPGTTASQANSSSVAASVWSMPGSAWWAVIGVPSHALR
jgi:hypothetical protein